MLSDFTFSDLPFDIPALPDTRPLQSEDPLAPLNFDDLLDIAHEFEFARTITHVWPCEEEPAEMRLDDILAALVPASPGECPGPLPGPAPTTVNPIHLDSANLCISADSVALSRDEVRATTGLPIVSTLQGWSPPSGSQFLDLDDALFLRKPEEDMRPAVFLATPPVRDVHLQMATTVLKPPAVNTTCETTDGPGKESMPTSVQPSTRVILETVQARFPARTPGMPSQTVMAPRSKTFKSRTHTPSLLATGGPIAANYARPPRGGIPPHIARSVTKANILRVEKERKVMQDAFSTAATKEAKKPSVLRRVAKGDGEASRIATSGSSGKSSFDWTENDEKAGRVAKRAKV